MRNCQRRRRGSLDSGRGLVTLWVGWDASAVVVETTVLMEKDRLMLTRVHPTCDGARHGGGTHC